MLGQKHVSSRDNHCDENGHFLAGADEMTLHRFCDFIQFLLVIVALLVGDISERQPFDRSK